MGVACSMCGGEESYIRGFDGEVRETDHLEEPGVDRRIILRRIF
jgi:hypothetical protein